MHEVSIVTTFFDIGRGSWDGAVQGSAVPDWQRRSTETYLERFGRLAALRNQMVIFTEPKFADIILTMRQRHGLGELTAIMVCDDLLGDAGRFPKLHASIKGAMSAELHQLVHNPGYPEFWNAEYVQLMALKPVFVCEAIDRKLAQHDQVAWIDFGYCRDDDRFDPAIPWRFDCGGLMNLFYVRPPDDRPIFDIVRSGTQYFQGCHAVGPAAVWHRYRELLDASLTSLLRCGLIHADEPCILMAYRQMPELFRIHAVDMADWFVIFRNFRDSDASASVHASTDDDIREVRRAAARPRADRVLEAFVTGAGRPDVIGAARALAERGIFVEIGTYTGEFAEWLCNGCAPRKLFCVDPYQSYLDYADAMNRFDLDAVFRDAQNRLGRFGERVEFIRTFSAEAAQQFPDGSLDFVYIDGNHAFRFVYEDLCLWYPKIRPGGLICGDDVVDTDEQQRNADGNVEIGWLRDSEGNITWGGQYGVLAAVRAFCSERALHHFVSGNQFLLRK